MSSHAATIQGQLALFGHRVAQSLPSADSRSSPAQFVRSRAEAFFASHEREGTRQAYARDVRQYLDWCEVQSLDPLRAASTDVAGFLNSPNHEGREYARATQLRRHTTLSRLYAYMVDEGVTVANPLLDVERASLGGRSQTYTDQHLKTAELRVLIEAADEHGEREAALMRLLVYNGLRPGELRNIRLNGLRLAGVPATAAVPLQRPRDGQDARVIVLNALTSEALRRYVAVRPTCTLADWVDSERDPGPLFLTRNGLPLSRQHVASQLRTLCRHAGIVPEASPDDVRCSFVALARSQGVPLLAVRAALGRADARRRVDRPGIRVIHPALRLASLEP